MNGGRIVPPVINCFYLTRVSHVGLMWRYKREKHTHDPFPGPVATSVHPPPLLPLASSSVGQVSVANL